MGGRSPGKLRHSAAERVRACAADCVPWDGRENPGEDIWTEDWTTNETRQIVARVEVTEMDGEHKYGFDVGCLLADWVFRTQGFGTHDVSSGLDATGTRTGLDR